MYRMSTYKISTKDLQGPIADKLESINISTFNDLSQIGLEVGSETIDGIMQALPEYSILQLAITSENNSSIYPNSTGTLIIEDIYSTGATFRFYAKIGEAVKVWKGLYVGNSFSGWNRVYSEQDPPKASDISGVATTDYVDTQITKITETGIPKLQVYPLDLIVGEEDQTEFAIDLSTFDVNTDTVLVQKGMLWLNPNGDYTVEDGKVVLSEGTSAGQTIGIWVWKNVPLGEDGSVSGTVIAPGTLPLNALPSTVVDAINGIEDLKKSVSDGKELVANAITAKGVNTATDAEFATMATNISSIVTLDSVPSLEAKTWTPSASDQTIAAGNYLKGDQTIAGDANLIAANIMSGVKIFGITGTAELQPKTAKKSVNISDINTLTVSSGLSAYNRSTIYAISASGTCEVKASAGYSGGYSTVTFLGTEKAFSGTSIMYTESRVSNGYSAYITYNRDTDTLVLQGSNGRITETNVTVTLYYTT